MAIHGPQEWEAECHRRGEVTADLLIALFINCFYGINGFEEEGMSLLPKPENMHPGWSDEEILRSARGEGE